MKNNLVSWFVTFVFFALTVPAADGPDRTALNEPFNDLDAWRPITFDKIPRHTAYNIIQEKGNSVLKAETHASASGLSWRETFDPAETPVLSWRWKVENVLRKGNATRKDGDDYPLRVYVVFKYDPDRAGALTRAKYALVKRLKGEYPPHSSLTYIWANRRHDQRILSSPYTDRAKMVVLQQGNTDIGRWVQEKVNILKDYRAAFGAAPPAEASIAIMSDSDNTGESATAFIDDIKLAAK